jgi:RimJ/RimL family protein N-acetyltransferase
MDPTTSSKPKATFPVPWYSLRYTSTTKPIPYIPLTLKTPLADQISLTPFAPHDGPELVSILSIFDVNKCLGATPHPYTAAHAAWWVSRQLSTSPVPPELPLQVIRLGDPATGTQIGTATLTRCPAEEGRPAGEYELGYFLSPDYHGKGIMRAAVLALLSWAKLEMKGTVRTVICRPEERN